jgi:hypothetical protein
MVLFFSTFLNQPIWTFSENYTPLNATSSYSLRPNSKEALRIKRAKVILWDEITMAPYYALDAIDIFLKELMNEPNSPFGGKIVVFGGDLMQTLPVVKHGDRKEHTLVRNMRVDKDATDYAESLLKIGRGELSKEHGVATACWNRLIPQPLTSLCAFDQSDTLAAGRERLAQKCCG